VLYVSVPLLAYCLGLGFKVEEEAGRLLAVLTLGAAGALGLAWAESGGRLDGLQFGVGEAAFFAGCVASALFPVLSKWGSLAGLAIGPGGAAHLLEPDGRRGPDRPASWDFSRRHRRRSRPWPVSDLLLVAYLGIF
jgi:hypothetical protein